jgi:hypothetical protein
LGGRRGPSWGGWGWGCGFCTHPIFVFWPKNGGWEGGGVTHCSKFASLYIRGLATGIICVGERWVQGVKRPCCDVCTLWQQLTQHDEGSEQLWFN